MANQHGILIKGTADFSSVTREVKRLTGTLSEALGDKGVELFDKDSLRFLKTEAQTSLVKMRTELKRLVEEAKNLDENLKNGNKTQEKHNELISKRYENLKKIASISKNIKEVKSQESRLTRGGVGSDQRNGGFMGRAGRAAAPATSALGGVQGIGTAVKMGGAVSDTLKGGAMAAGAAGLTATAGQTLGIGLIAAAAIAAAKAISNMIEAASYFSDQVPLLIKGAAMGLGPSLSGRSQRLGANLGFGADETIKQRLDVAKAFGTQRGTRGQENITANLQSAGRGLGIDPSELAGAGNQLRASMGVRGAESGMAQILSKAFEQGMDKSQATSLLNATVGALTDINKSGLMSNEAIVNTIGNLSKNNMMAPEQAAKLITGMSSAMQHSQGASQAFFQMSAANAGVGGGNLFGTQAAVQQGLVGVDRNRYLSQTGGADRGDKRGLSILEKMGLVGGGEYTQNLMKGQIDTLDKMFGKQDTDETVTAKARFLGESYGVQGLPQQLQMLDLVKKMGSGLATDKEKKTMEKLTMDPESRWRAEALAALQNLPGNIAKALAGLSGAKFRGGEALAENVTPNLIKADTATYNMTNSLVGAGNGLLSDITAPKSQPGILDKGADFLFGEAPKDKQFPTIGDRLGNRFKKWTGGDDPDSHNSMLGMMGISTSSKASEGGGGASPAQASTSFSPEALELMKTQTETLKGLRKDVKESGSLRPAPKARRN